MINWNKPIRLVQSMRDNSPVHVSCEENNNRLIYWYSENHKVHHAMVTADGRLISTLSAGRNNPPDVFIENIPEEPKNCLVLEELKDGWYLQTKHPMTKTEAEILRKRLDGSGLTIIV